MQIRRAISHSHITYSETVPNCFPIEFESGQNYMKHTIDEPQNLVSFKKFPCTDGLGSTETVRDKPYCNTSDSM